MNAQDITNLPSLRVVLLRDYPTSPEAEQSSMRVGGLALSRTQNYPHGISAHWASSSLEADVTIEQLASNSELACAYFTGNDRVTLAAKLVSVLSYLPIELMHLVARASTVFEERQAALTTLGQFYSVQNGVSYWDSDIELTIDLGWRDPDPRIRIDTAAAEVKCNPARGKRSIEHALSKESDSDLREVLKSLYHTTEPGDQDSGTITAAKVGSLRLSDDPLVVPMYRPESMDDLLSHFTGNTTVVTRRQVEAEGEIVADVAELKPNHFDATIILAIGSWDVGSVSFGGPDQVVVAVGSGHALKYFPIHLAKVVAVRCSDSELRRLALRALTFASSRRMFPGPDVDPEIAMIIASAANDPDPRIRLAALSAFALLREELGIDNHPSV